MRFNSSELATTERELSAILVFLQAVDEGTRLENNRGILPGVAGMGLGLPVQSWNVVRAHTTK